jgi:hypothetical protein
MKTLPPSDAVIMLTPAPALTARDRKRLVTMRREAGAVELRITVSARPAGSDAWRPVRGTTRVYRVHSALNAEQVILGGPTAGQHFAATRALLEFYEQQHQGERDK